MTGGKLTDGEVTSASVTTDVLPNSIRIDRYPRLAQRLVGASSTAATVANSGGPQVNPPPRASETKVEAVVNR